MAKINNLKDWVAELKQTTKLILVEGIKDKIALEKLGINKKTLTINCAHYKLIESIADENKECILLLDLDKEGKKLYSIFRHHLQARKVKIDKTFREFLFRKTKLTQIQGIYNYSNKELKDLDS